MNKRVLIVSNFFPPIVVGGAEVVAFRQAQALQSRGYQVTVFAGGFPSPTSGAGDLDYEIIDGIEVYRLTHRSLNPDQNFWWPAAENRLTSLIMTCRPDIAHFHNVSGLGASLIPLSKRCQVKSVVTLHDHWGFCFKNTLLKDDLRICNNYEECAGCLPSINEPDGTSLPIRMRRDFVAWCLGQADVLISPSNYLAEAYGASDLITRPVRHLSNGINLRDLPSNKTEMGEHVRFACLSYLGQHKGIATLLDAAERLVADPSLRGRWHLTFAGTGQLADRITNDISAGRFSDSVTYLGKLDHTEALELTRSSDVVIVPSLWPENEPVTLLEAVATGTVQIASRIGGNVELVDDGQSGILFKPGDVAGLVHAMKSLIQNPALIRKFREYNLGRREQFDESSTISRLIDIYEAPTEARKAADILVICAGRAPVGDLEFALHRFHEIERRDRRIRFIWHEWASADIWRESKLLWLWDAEGEPEWSLLNRALRYGLSVLVPSSSLVAPLVDSIGSVATYENLLQAIGSIASLQEAPEMSLELGECGPAMSRFLTRIAPRSSFYLTV